MSVACLWPSQHSLFAPKIQHIVSHLSPSCKKKENSRLINFINFSQKYQAIDKYSQSERHAFVSFINELVARWLSITFEDLPVYFEATRRRTNARCKADSGIDQVARRYSQTDSRIRRSI